MASLCVGVSNLLRQPRPYSLRVASNFVTTLSSNLYEYLSWVFVLCATRFCSIFFFFFYYCARLSSRNELLLCREFPNHYDHNLFKFDLTIIFRSYLYELLNVTIYLEWALCLIPGETYGINEKDERSRTRLFCIMLAFLSVFLM